MENPLGGLKENKELEVKKYLYHMVPNNMEGNIIYPLSSLPKHLYLKNLEKYQKKDKEGKDRLTVLENFIPNLEASWKEVINLSPIEPSMLKQSLKDAGFDPGEIKFYQIDPDKLDLSKSVICLFNYNEQGNELEREYIELNNDNLEKIHNHIPKKSLQSYIKQVKLGNKPLYFLGVPHVFHKDSIDISDSPVIIV